MPYFHPVWAPARRARRAAAPFGTAEALESRTLLSFGPAGPEFRVNTAAPENQYSPSAAMDADGDFVVAWQSFGQDGSNYGVYAQRYNAAGAARGSEFQVNTTTFHRQQRPSVAMDADGDFVVAWQSYAQDGSNYGIYAQRYNAAGLALGGEFRVNTTTDSSQTAPSAAMDADGDFVVAWQSYAQDGSNFGIYAQRFNAAGIPQGGEFQVNTGTPLSQTAPSAAMDADGDFVVTWASYRQDGSSYGVYAQRYSAVGIAQGGEFRVNTTTVSDQSNPAAAMDGEGDFVVAWASDDQDGSEGGIYARRYNAAGAAQGSEFLVNTTTALSQTSPSVAMDERGDFVVAWASSAQDGNDRGIYAQRYNAGGFAVEGEFLVNTTTAAAQNFPSAAMDRDGDIIVTWASDGQEGVGYGANYGVFARRYVKIPAVAGRFAFYNRSPLDGNDATANGNDDRAIAPNKGPLVAGQTGSFSNVTSYDKGLNGIMVDVEDFPAAAGLTVNDFSFRSGRTADPAGFAAGPFPVDVRVRPGAGLNGTDRVTLIFRDYNPQDPFPQSLAAANGWLEVTVKASANTGLPAPHVFYFGNLIGDANGDLRVNALDVSAVRQDLNKTVPVTGRADFNRDGRVNALDLATVRRNLNRSVPPLKVGEGVLDVFVDLDRSGTFEAGELAGEDVDLGDVTQGKEKVFLRLVNSGSGPLVLDGELLLAARDDGPGGPGFGIDVRQGAPANVTLVKTSVERATPTGGVVTDVIVHFEDPAAPGQPKVLQPGESIELEITGNVIGAAAGSGAPTRRGKRLRFTGRVV